MIIALLTMVALLSIGSVSAVSVRSDLRSAGAERQKTVATYAAESGIAAGMQFLRENLNATTNWGAYVTPNNTTPMEPNLIIGTGVRPHLSGNVFTGVAWYRVHVLNNVGDAGFAAGEDQDGRVILRATGYGPDGASAIVEVEVRAMGGTPAGRPCPVYGQRGISDDGAGRNDCLGVINGTDVQTFRPTGAP